MNGPARLPPHNDDDLHIPPRSFARSRRPWKHNCHTQRIRPRRNVCLLSAELHRSGTQEIVVVEKVYHTNAAGTIRS